MTSDASGARPIEPPFDEVNPMPVEEQAARLRDDVRAKLAAIVESSDDAIISKTLDGVIRTWNRGAERMFGWASSEVVGTSIHVIIPLERYPEEASILQRLRRGERIEHFETVRMTKDGRHIDISVTVSPVRDASGVIVGASKIARDITEQKRIQEELRIAKEAAESAGRAKDEFLSLLSHELRTPLTPVLGALSFLARQEGLSDETRAEIEMIRRNVETESRLVDDLLDLTRLQGKNLRLHFEVVDAHDAARGSLLMFDAEAKAKDLEIKLDLPAKEHHVWADPGRLQQVLLNFLSNAVKFTPPGGAITITSANKSPDRLSLEVRDTGIGVEPDMLPRLFNPFEQAEQGKVRRYAGLGLGLSIARSLVEMHEGTLRASSEGLGKGATFTLEMATISAAKAQAMEAAPLIAASGCRVLLVEDHDDTRQVMTRLLLSFGCSVHAAANVGQAIELADREAFDLLISDIGLPDGSGLDVMRHMRGRHKVKGVAVSGFGQADDYQRSRDAGFDIHLTKPVNFHMLRDVIRKVAG